MGEARALWEEVKIEEEGQVLVFAFSLPLAVPCQAPAEQERVLRLLSVVLSPVPLLVAQLEIVQKLQQIVAQHPIEVARQKRRRRRGCREWRTRLGLGRCPREEEFQAQEELETLLQRDQRSPLPSEQPFRLRVRFRRR